MNLIWTNGTLLKITAPGTSGDYDVPESAGTDRWTGSADITVRRDPIVEVQGGQALDVVRSTRLEIGYDVGRLVQQNDTLTYTHEGRTWARRVDDITRVQMTGRVRIELEPAA